MVAAVFCKLLRKKREKNHQSTCTPRVYYTTHMCYGGIYSTRVCGSICNAYMYSVYKILRFITLLINFSETYIQHCQNITSPSEEPSTLVN